MQENDENIEDAIIIEESTNVGGQSLEFKFLMDTLLDYFESTGGKASQGEGEAWKKGTIHESVVGIDVPEEIQKEVTKTFIFQLKKFQK